MPIRTAKPDMTRARALFIKLIEQYCIPGYRLSLLEIQKLAYFLQKAGEPLNLRFTKHLYGPYAENLNFLLQRIEGHFIRGYGDRSKDAQLYLLPHAAEEADEFLSHDTNAEERLSRISHLIEGFETPYGMELLATVYWISNDEEPSANDVDSATAQVLSWNPRKQKLFKPDHIRSAWQRLHNQQWL